VRTLDADDLVKALRTAAVSLVRRPSLTDLEQTLELIVRGAVDAVPGVHAAGISMTENGQVTSRAPTDPDVRVLDVLQSHLHEGPCVTALTDPPADGVVRVDDLGAEHERWPRFAPRARAHGFAAMMSVQLVAENDYRVALNLYSRKSHSFDDRSRSLAGLFGIQAAVALYGARHAEGLNRALATRDRIGQAKGILMERFGVGEDEAFRMLVKASQDTNVKLHAVAAWLTGASTRHPGIGTRDGELLTCPA